MFRFSVFANLDEHISYGALANITDTCEFEHNNVYVAKSRTFGYRDLL